MKPLFQLILTKLYNVNWENVNAVLILLLGKTEDLVLCCSRNLHFYNFIFQDFSWNISENSRIFAGNKNFTETELCFHWCLNDCRLKDSILQKLVQYCSNNWIKYVTLGWLKIWPDVASSSSSLSSSFFFVWEFALWGKSHILGSPVNISMLLSNWVVVTSEVIRLFL